MYVHISWQFSSKTAFFTFYKTKCHKNDEKVKKNFQNVFYFHCVYVIETVIKEIIKRGNSLRWLILVIMCSAVITQCCILHFFQKHLAVMIILAKNSKMKHYEPSLYTIIWEFNLQTVIFQAHIHFTSSTIRDSCCIFNAKIKT